MHIIMSIWMRLWTKTVCVWKTSTMCFSELWSEVVNAYLELLLLVARGYVMVYLCSEWFGCCGLFIPECICLYLYNLSVWTNVFMHHMCNTWRWNQIAMTCWVDRGGNTWTCPLRTAALHHFSICPKLLLDLNFH